MNAPVGFWAKRGGKWRMALRNLARNKRRNAATGVAIALGFAAMLALGGYVLRVQNYLRVYTIYATRVGHLTIFKTDGLDQYSVKPRLYSLTAQDQEQIRAALQDLPNVELHGPQLAGAGLIGNGCRTLPFIATGIDPALDRQLRAHPEMQVWAPNIKDYTKGRGLWEFPAEVGAIAISEGLARLLHKPKVFDELPPGQKPVLVTDCNGSDAKDKIAQDTNVQLAAGTWAGMMSALDGEIVANFTTGVTETNNSAVLTSLTHLQKLYDTENATFYSIWLKNPDLLASSERQLRTLLQAKGLKVDLYPWTDEAMAPFYTGTMQFLYTMVAFITVVLVTVIVFSVFNAATMTVIERSQEIGMMRSLGFTRRQIRRLFVMEMAALAGLSLVIGGVMAGVGIFAVNHARIDFNPPGIAGGMKLLLTVNSKVVFLSAILILVLAVLTTLVAVRQIVKGNIATLVLGTQR